MKRSNQVVLVLSGALTAAPLGCGLGREEVITADQTYTNNQHVAGAGYYHAPYHAWYPYPYNSFIPGRGYFHGGQWSEQPHQSTVTASRPTTESAKQAQAAHQSTTAKRGGFGSSSRFSSGIT